MGILAIAMLSGCGSELGLGWEGEESNDSSEPIERERGSAPIARCRIDPTPAFVGTAGFVLDGSASSDPDGESIARYRWELIEAPPAGDFNLNGARAVVDDLVFPVTGDYTFELVVTDAEGLKSEPCTTSVRAKPASGIWVEAWWTVGSHPISLHLVRDGGPIGFTSQNDCNRETCIAGLSWGAPGAGDDPIMVAADDGEAGPESIELLQPGDTQYRVLIGTAGMEDTLFGDDVTVRLWVDGRFARQTTLTVFGEQDFVPVWLYKPADGSVVEL